jgi:hypothetical protein
MTKPNPALPNYRRRTRLLLFGYMLAPMPIVIMTAGRALVVVPAYWLLWLMCYLALPSKAPLAARAWTVAELMPAGVRNFARGLPGFLLLIVGPALLAADRVTSGVLVTSLGALAAVWAIATATKA